MKTIYKKILVGVDASEKAKRAVEKVMELQRKENSTIVAFHSIQHHMIPQEFSVAPSMEPSPNYGISTQTYDKIQEFYKQRGKQVLQQIEKMFQESNLAVETRLVEKKSPEQYITTTVEKENFDLVVVGCTGEHSKLEKIFLGTVAEAVVNNAPCDVLIVR